MFAGDQLSGYVPDVGIQETMSEHGDAPLWKIKYVKFYFDMCLLMRVTRIMTGLL